MRQPVLFVAHGSPMNAIETNAFTQALPSFITERPKAILCVSAHWLTEGTKVLGNENPRTIHDFGGFPDELFRIQYPAPGAPDWAARIAERMPDVAIDLSWGFDHGTWSILRHMQPAADIPVLQLSLDVRIDLEAHVDMGRRLSFLRDEGVLIIGSGNITHNLREISGQGDKPWALAFDAMIRDALLSRNLAELTAQDKSKHGLWAKAHPSLEHYVPLLYAVGAADEQERPSFLFEGMQAGSLSMRSVRYG